MVEVGSIYEPERQIRDTNLGLDCHIQGHAPVVAEGHLAGCPFYFRARHSSWTFTLCLNADIDPSAIDEGNELGFFRRGEFCGYAQQGDYGTNHEASYMPYEIAEHLIRECAARFLIESANANRDSLEQ